MKNIRFLKVGDDMKTITRAKYLDRIIELNGTPDIKIITGIRRSGKSKLMQAYIEYLKSHFENINIIFIDFMDLAYEEIKEYHALHAYVEEHYQESKTNYLFVDEVQMCPKFELAINSLYRCIQKADPGAAVIFQGKQDGIYVLDIDLGLIFLFIGKTVKGLDHHSRVVRNDNVHSHSRIIIYFPQPPCF